jgi:hypothetical protein
LSNFLKIGFGNGDTLVEMAQANPALNYVGIEVYEAGIGRLINILFLVQGLICQSVLQNFGFFVN